MKTIASLSLCILFSSMICVIHSEYTSERLYHRPPHSRSSSSQTAPRRPPDDRQRQRQRQRTTSREHATASFSNSLQIQEDVSNCITAEGKLALQVFFNNTGGQDQWVNNSGWSSNPSDQSNPCSWFGMECATTNPGNTCLVSLSLENNGLTGQLPSLNAVVALNSIDLLGNNLNGTIPSFSALTQLQYLGLSDNSLVGTIPSESLDSLVNLQQLHLDGNELSGTIPSLSTLTSLQQLILSWNALSGTIPSFSTLTNLTTLALDDNQLTGTIPSFSTLINLQNLALETNWLSGAVPLFETLTQLQVLTLNRNQLESVPSFDSLTALQMLGVGFNQLTGTIPPFEHLTSLQSLFLNVNQLTGTIPSFPTLVNLQEIYLEFNQLTGTVPAFSQLINLQTLSLESNQLTGTLPSFSALTGLTDLNFGTNFLGGTIPSFSTLTNLSSLTLSGNNFTGAVPDFALENLGTLLLDSNQLTSFPDFSHLSSLNFLYLRNNLFSSTIPAFSALVNLQGLYIDMNQISGTVPSFENLTKLGELYAGYNLLSGTLPSFDGLPLLTLSLGNNRLNGTIPSFSTQSHMYWISLEHNELSGSIPPLDALLKLQLLHLADNQLTGTIQDFDSFANLAILLLQGNNLSGSIPPFTHNTNLTTLDLSRNFLSGTIPSFSWLVSLQKINLSQNLLEGRVPSFSPSLSSLRTLVLDDNRLTALPPSWLPAEVTFFSGLFRVLDVGLRDVIEVPPNLSYISISRNFLTMQIRDALQSLYALDTLIVLDLSHNRLAGSLGEESLLFYDTYQIQRGFDSLCSLDLSFNLISGDLSLLYQFPSTLSILNLADNLFSGSISNSYEGMSLLNVSSNPALKSSALPSFVVVDYSSTQHFGENFSCGTLSSPDHSRVYVLDLSYSNYSYCHCTPGFGGRPPRCDVCPVGLITNQSLLSCPGCESVCQSCPFGSYPLENTCVSCTSDEYLNGSVCQTCISNAICSSGLIVPSNGYWLSFSSVGAFVYSCQMGACVTTKLSYGCGLGRIQDASLNLLCGRCENGFSEWSGTCVDCTEGTQGVLVFLLLLLAMLLSFVLYLTHRFPVRRSASTSDHSSSLSTSDYSSESHADIELESSSSSSARSDTVTDLSTGRVGILIYFIQTATLLASTNSQTSYAFWFQLVNFNIVNAVSGGTTCPFATSSEFPLFTALISQLVLLCLVPVPFLARRCLYRSRILQRQPAWSRELDTVNSSASGPERMHQHAYRSLCLYKEHWNRWALLRGILAVYWYGFYSVMGACLQYFHCVPVWTWSGQQVLLVSSLPSVECTSDFYHQYSILFAVILSVELAVPVTLAFLLLRHEYSDGSKSRRRLSAYPSRLSHVLSQFYSSYSPHRVITFLWELVNVFVRRLPLLLVVIFVSDPATRLGLCGILTLLHLCLHMLLRPFQNRVSNLLEALSLLGLSVLVNILLISTRAENSDFSTSNSLAVVILVSVIVVLLALFCTTPYLGSLKLRFALCLESGLDYISSLFFVRTGSDSGLSSFRRSKAASTVVDDTSLSQPLLSSFRDQSATQ